MTATTALHETAQPEIRAWGERRFSRERASGAHRQARALPPSLVAGLLLLAVIAGAAIGADTLVARSPLRAAGAPLQPPGAAYWMGTDDLGRDVLARVLHGGRTSLLVALLVVLTSGVCGTLVGGLAGFLGGWVDDLLMRLAELVLVVPRFFLAIVIAALFGRHFWLIGVLLGLTFWPGTARLLRAQLLSLREREFVLAARAVGAAEGRILWRHVLPHALPVALVSTALQVGTAILVEASLSFLGLGDQSVVSWGAMLNSAQTFVRAAWWMSVFPGLAILLTVLAATFFADGLQDVLDPRLHRQAGRASG